MFQKQTPEQAERQEMLQYIMRSLSSSGQELDTNSIRSMQRAAQNTSNDCFSISFKIHDAHTLKELPFNFSYGLETSDNVSTITLHSVKLEQVAAFVQFCEKEMPGSPVLARS